LVALFSEDEIKRKELSQQYGVPAFTYEEYKAFLRSGAADAVYIALPNHLHCE
jgi:glucose-fructose oxidoreductase